METLKNFAVKVMGMTDDEAAALLDADGNITDTAFDTLAKKDRERLARLNETHKEELTLKFNDGHSKAKREERAKYEDEIKTHFGIDSKAIGVDLIKDVVSQGSKNDVKTHPDYLALERKLQNDYIKREDYDVVKGEYDSFKQKVERDSMLSRVKQDGKSVFYGLNPVLSKDKQRALNQEQEFLRKLEDYNYQVQPDGNHLILDKDGKRIVNENMNPVTFQDFVKEKTLAYFDVQEQEPAGNSGTQTSRQSEPTEAYKSRADFYKQYANEGDPAKAKAMYESAKEQGIV